MSKKEGYMFIRVKKTSFEKVYVAAKDIKKITINSEGYIVETSDAKWSIDEPEQVKEMETLLHRENLIL